MRVKELIELLSRCPENDLLMIDSEKELDADIDWDINDVFVGTGTLKGFSYLKIIKENEPTNYKSCNTCIHKKCHDEMTENGNVPMCCIHCKWAEDLHDKWKAGEQE